MEEIRIEIIDGHELYRRGLCAALGELPEIVGIVEAMDADGGLKLAKMSTPNLAIMDLFLPGACGMELVRDLRRSVPECRILILTFYASEQYALEALDAGVSGYALKDQCAADVIEAVRTVLRGETYLAPRLPPTLFERVRTAGGRARLRHGPLGELSSREREVFELAVRAFTNETIGSTLGISVKTVETHRSRINRKLNVHSTGELIRFAALHGLLVKQAEP